MVKKNIENLKAHQYFIVDCCSLLNFNCNTCIIIQLKQVDHDGNGLACVASVSVWFQGKGRLRDGIYGFDRAKNGLSFLVLCSKTARKR